MLGRRLVAPYASMKAMTARSTPLLYMLDSLMRKGTHGLMRWHRRTYASSTEEKVKSTVKDVSEKAAATLTSSNAAADAKAKSFFDKLGPSGAFNILAGTGLGAFLLSKEYLILDAHFAVALSFGAFLTLAVTKGGPMLKSALRDEIKVRTHPPFREIIWPNLFQL